jgi:hypothetical protein
VSVTTEVVPQVASVERLICDVLRWHELVLDLSDCASFDEVTRAVVLALEETQGSHGVTHPLAVRLRLVGTSAAHGALFGLEAQLRAQVQAIAVALPGHGLWIERVQIRTQALPVAAIQEDRDDALVQMQALLAFAPQDQAFLDSLQQDLLLLVSKLPMELHADLPVLQAIREGRLQGLVADISPSVLAHIAAVENQ